MSSSASSPSVDGRWRSRAEGVLPSQGWALIIDLFVGVAVAIAVTGLLLDTGPARDWSTPIVFVLVAAAGIAWILLRRTHARRDALLFASLTGGLLLLPASSLVALLTMVGIVIVALYAGLRTALLATAFAIAAMTFSMVVWYDASVLDIVIQDATFAVLLLFGVCLGALARTAETARVETARLNTELVSANDRLRAAMRKERELVLAEERARSARELHDGLGHQLTLASMSLQFAQRVRASDPEQSWDEVQRAETVVRRALQDVRMWARALHDGGDGAARSTVADVGVEGIARPFANAGLQVDVRQSTSLDRLDDEGALFVTRFIQEGLTNVLKHADAQRAEIAVAGDDQRLSIAIRDDGGDANEVDVPGFGLRSLTERADALGGEIGYAPGDSGGFELKATVPMRGPRQPAHTDDLLIKGI